jgi:hypothetical protein
MPPENFSIFSAFAKLKLAGNVVGLLENTPVLV